MQKIATFYTTKISQRGNYHIAKFYTVAQAEQNEWLGGDHAYRFHGGGSRSPTTGGASHNHEKNDK